MNYKILVTKSFKKEYIDIIKYFLDILQEKAAATNFNNELKKIVSLVKSNPDLFSISREKELAKRGYHKANVNNYLVLYKVSNNKIFLAHIFHQTQDYAKLV